MHAVRRRRACCCVVDIDQACTGCVAALSCTAKPKGLLMCCLANPYGGRKLRDGGLGGAGFNGNGNGCFGLVQPFQNRVSDEPG